MENKPEEPAWLVYAATGLMSYAFLVLVTASSYVLRGSAVAAAGLAIVLAGLFGRNVGWVDTRGRESQMENVTFVRAVAVFIGLSCAIGGAIYASS